ncbi:hypothetical protein GCM10018791_45760 [Streptomyces zaomyceticus]|nr:hypothetical protein GCM10018791_45760 [Streptomyces zaomyceticus]
MLMLQPPGSGSTYRYLLPDRTLRKHPEASRALVRRMHPAPAPVYVTPKTPKHDLLDLPHTGGALGAMMGPP